MIWKTFRLYPDLHWLYVDVIIHHNKKAMYKALPQCKPHTFDGICRSWVTIFDRVDAGSKRFFISQPKVGEIHLHRGRCTVGISSHEICHAVHHYFWLRRRSNAGQVLRDYNPRWNDCSTREEAFCWVMGEMYRQFCVNYHSGTTAKKVKQRTILPVRKGTKILMGKAKKI